MGSPSPVRLLLDTHIWIWSLGDRERVSRRVSRELESAENELWLSPISAWELLLLVGKGRVRLDRAVDDWLAQADLSLPAREAPVTREVALESRRVDLPHQDPADRFLAATARVYDLTFVTADRRFFKTRQFSILANR